MYLHAQDHFLDAGSETPGSLAWCRDADRQCAYQCGSMSTVSLEHYQASSAPLDATQTLPMDDASCPTWPAPAPTVTYQLQTWRYDAAFNPCDNLQYRASKLITKSSSDTGADWLKQRCLTEMETNSCNGECVAFTTQQMTNFWGTFSSCLFHTPKGDAVDQDNFTCDTSASRYTVGGQLDTIKLYERRTTSG